jgi:hypothetical protein
MANGKWQMANGKWQMANGKWQMANGKWNWFIGFGILPLGVWGSNTAWQGSVYPFLGKFITGVG